MNRILQDRGPRLFYAAQRLNSAFPSNAGWLLNHWYISDDWHEMTIDTNADKSSGLDGGIAVDCLGSWLGGSISRNIALSNFGEIVFEHYVQNSLPNTPGEENRISFFVDNIKKLEVTGPSPWQCCEPIGLTPGFHSIRFDYVVSGAPSGKKGVIDNISILEAVPVNCLISNYSPPKPSKSLGRNKVLRGFTRFQEMAQADTEIKFSAVFTAHAFLEFIIKSNSTFYFVDEFNICYRGVFPDIIAPKNIAPEAYYSVDLVFLANQKTGIGLCRIGSILPCID